MAKHTPGPWNVDDIGDEIVDISGYSVATCNFRVLRTAGQNVEQRFQNARLIAAAPEILEALKGLLKEVETISLESFTRGKKTAMADWKNQDPSGFKLCMAARAALAKAEGKPAQP